MVVQMAQMAILAQHGILPPVLVAGCPDHIMPHISKTPLYPRYQELVR